MPDIRIFIQISFILSLFMCSVKANADMNTAMNNICSTVMSDDLEGLQEKIKNLRDHYKLKPKHYYAGISCNGNSLLRAALLSGSTQTGELLITLLPKVNLVSPGPDGKTLHQWIIEKEMSKSPIAQALMTRLAIDLG